MNGEQNQEQFSEYLVEQLRLYENQINQIIDRKERMNRFYISLLVVLFLIIAFVPAILKFDFWSDKKSFYFGISLVGIVLSLLWLNNFAFYMKILSEKFKLFEKMKKNMPYPYENGSEWPLLKTKYNLERWIVIVSLCFWLYFFIKFY